MADPGSEPTTESLWLGRQWQRGQSTNWSQVAADWNAGYALLAGLLGEQGNSLSSFLPCKRGITIASLKVVTKVKIS